METIGFIGTGRLGTVLAHAMAGAGLPVRYVASRRHDVAIALAQALPGCSAVPAEQAATASLVFVTVSDDAIAGMVESLPWHQGQCVVHCSGATEVSALAHAAAAGASTGGFHPIQIFTDVASTLPLLPGTTVGIEAEGRLSALLHDIAGRLAMVPMTIPPGKRALYHGGSLFMSSFLLSMFDQSVRLWQTLGMSEAQTLAALLPLAQGVVHTAGQKGLANAIAGPVSRGDGEVIRRHMAALAETDGHYLQMYRAFTHQQLILARQAGKLPVDRVEAMQQIIDGADIRTGDC